MTGEQLQRKLQVRQIKLSGIILAGAVFCALAYLLGLVIGSRL